VIDVDPASAKRGEIVGRVDMPNVGDELHHFGWNACSSACHSELRRDTLIVPGFRSGRIVERLHSGAPGTPKCRRSDFLL
jgi:methanethiol oxidase